MLQFNLSCCGIRDEKCQSDGANNANLTDQEPMEKKSVDEEQHQPVVVRPPSNRSTGLLQHLSKACCGGNLGDAPRAAENQAPRPLPQLAGPAEEVTVKEPEVTLVVKENGGPIEVNASEEPGLLKVEKENDEPNPADASKDQPPGDEPQEERQETSPTEHTKGTEADESPAMESTAAEHTQGAKEDGPPAVESTTASAP